MHRLYGPGEAKHRAELKRQRAGRHRNHAEIVLAHADCESPTSAALPFPQGSHSLDVAVCSPAVARIVALKRVAGAPRIAQRPCSTQGPFRAAGVAAPVSASGSPTDGPRVAHADALRAAAGLNR
jgi:hypothetical protein